MIMQDEDLKSTPKRQKSERLLSMKHQKDKSKAVNVEDMDDDSKSNVFKSQKEERQRGKSFLSNVDLASAGVNTLNQNLEFDHKLNEKSQIRKSKNAMKRYLFQKKWLSGVKNVVIFIFYIVVPFLQTPDWCV
jgi:hypothetical protein